MNHELSKNSVFFSSEKPGERIPAKIIGGDQIVLQAEVPHKGSNGALTVLVDNDEIESQPFYYQGNISFHTISPDHGGVGDLIYIYGGPFSRTTKENKVTFSPDVSAEVLESDSDRLLVSVPPGVRPGPVTVELEDERYRGAVFTFEEK